MSTPRKTLPGGLKEQLTDVTTGLYMISSTCGLVDAICFLALGGVFAEMMTGNLLLMALSIGTGRSTGQSTRYIPAIVASAWERCSGAACCAVHRNFRNAASALLSNGF
jgi:uncharacterized membrane protein YoaK (UPF0700 family)